MAKIICPLLLQVAKSLAESLSTASSLCQVNGLKLGRELWAPAMGALDRCQGLSFKSKGKNKCVVARYETLYELFRTRPGYGDKDAPTPPNLVVVCKAYATGPLKDEAASLLEVRRRVLRAAQSLRSNTFLLLLTCPSLVHLFTIVSISMFTSLDASLCSRQARVIRVF